MNMGRKKIDPVRQESYRKRAHDFWAKQREKAAKALAKKLQVHLDKHAGKSSEEVALELSKIIIKDFKKR